MDDPSTRGSSALAIMGVFVTLAGIVVTLRLYTRFILLRNPGPEDYTIIMSLVSTLLVLPIQWFEEGSKVVS
jgi:hypothetical protein